ncbi:MAG: hypothetical protein JXA23_08300 [Bacteroidales bacterium]|nr:hypothetical protein [Bacteroidales bacterium]
METNIPFDKYMDQHFEFAGQWGTPSVCGLKVIRRKDGKTLVIATEIYRQNPGTPVTEWVAPLANRLMNYLEAKPETFIFVEHTPDLKSKLTFYGETFDRVDFDWDGEKFVNPRWTRLTREEVDRLMEE